MNRTLGQDIDGGRIRRYSSEIRGQLHQDQVLNQANQPLGREYIVPTYLNCENRREGKTMVPSWLVDSIEGVSLGCQTAMVSGEAPGEAPE